MQISHTFRLSSRNFVRRVEKSVVMLIFLLFWNKTLGEHAFMSRSKPVTW